MSFVFFDVYNMNDLASGPVDQTHIPFPTLHDLWGRNHEHFVSLLSNVDSNSNEFFVDAMRVQDMLLGASQTLRLLLEHEGDPSYLKLDTLICNADNLFGLVLERARELCDHDHERMNQIYAELNKEYFLTLATESGETLIGQWDPMLKGDSFTKFYLLNLQGRVVRYTEEGLKAMRVEVEHSAQCIEWMFNVLEADFFGKIVSSKDQQSVLRLFGQVYRVLRESGDYIDWRLNRRQPIS